MGKVSNKNKAAQSATKTASLELKVEPTFTFSNTVVLMMQTGLLGFETALALNDAYGLELTRNENDVTLDFHDANGLELTRKENDETPSSVAYSLHYYNNEATKLKYILIDCPKEQRFKGAFARYDKMLIIQGRDGWQILQKMYYEITHPWMIKKGGDMRDENHFDIVNKLKNGVTVIDYFSFDEIKGEENSLPKNEQGRISKFYKDYIKNLKSFLLKLYRELTLLIVDDEDYYIEDDRDGLIGDIGLLGEENPFGENHEEERVTPIVTITEANHFDKNMTSRQTDNKREKAIEDF